MKKILSVLILAFGLISSAHALDVSLGFSGNFGGNIGSDYSGYNGYVTGGGFYANFACWSGFGFQGEINWVNNQIEYSKADKSLTLTDYQSVDFAIMPWYVLDLRVVSLGFGLGFNFAYYDDSIDNLQVESDRFIPGIATGFAFKTYLARHFGLVFGLHGVFDFFPSIEVTESGKSTTYSFNDSEFIRKSIYGSLGLDFRF